MNPIKSSGNNNSSSKSPNSGKNSLANLAAYNSATQRALVPPLLRDVGKLAAGVASVHTGGITSAASPLPGGGGVSGRGDIRNLGTSSSGSATGNPRNKCALKPGHSLMDWIRLGASGKDLTGVGARAGHLSVTPKELELHCKEDDAWLAIRGKIYNISAYLPFHPGGPEELMKGAGKDATHLFDEIHPWVNYEQILQKCYIGRLNLIDPNLDTESLFFGKPEPNSPQLLELEQLKPNGTPPPSLQPLAPPPLQPSKPPLNLPQLSATTANEETVNNATTPTTITRATSPELLLPRFDWIQKLDYITVIFYTGAFSNPLIEIHQAQTSLDLINIFLTYNNMKFDNEIKFHQNVQWPCQIKVTCETGKVEFLFRKSQSAIWENYGVLCQKNKIVASAESKSRYLLINKLAVNYNTCLMEFERIDRGRIVIPLGKHVKVFEDVGGQQISRSYTPVPSCLFDKFQTQQYITDNICLMVKRYPDGNVSRIFCDHQVGDIVTISKPLGNFDLQTIERRETFILFAAGTGITPMLSLILFLLERRIRKCQHLRLVFFNKTSKDILLQNQLVQLEKEDNRFKVQHVLSQSDDSWRGLKGHISRSLVEEIIGEHLKNTTYTKQDLFLMACGPTIFTTLAHQILNNIGCTENQLHLFLG